MQDEKERLQCVPFKKRKIRMIGCRDVGLQFRSFIGHSTRRFVGEVCCRVLNFNRLCNTPSEAMITVHDLLLALAIKYGSNPTGRGSKSPAKNWS